MQNLLFAFLIVGGVLACTGALLFTFKADSLWKITGLIMVVVGAISALVSIFATNWVAALIILSCFLAVIALMYRQGWLPKS